MNRLVSSIAVFAMGLPITVIAGQTDPPSPKQQYSSIFKEYGPVSGALRKATTDLERKAAVQRLGTYPSRFVELAEKYPADPIALVALRQAVQALGSTDSAAQITWETNRSNFPTGASDGSARRIVVTLLRHHVLSDKLGPVVDRARYAYRMEFEPFLQTVLEKNPHHDVQGLACLALAQFLNDKMRVLEVAKDRPELSDCHEIVFGENYLTALQRLDRAKLAARIESLFDRAADEFSDVKFRRGTIGDVAKSELYDIRHLGIGKVAPQISGKDQDGKSFKLTDYRGKVVLLYFWSEY